MTERAQAHPGDENPGTEHPADEQLPAAPDPAVLRAHLDGRWAQARRSARELFADPRCAPPPFDADLATHRERVLDQLLLLVDAGATQGGFPSRYGGGDDLGGWITGFEMLGFGDLSLLVKVGVQFGLFAGAILHLGTERHHQAYLQDAINARLLGCFAMTETGHGSDVASVRTTATYHPGTREFDVHTPYEAARKDYIGNAGEHGRLAVVFAQLITEGESKGVHALLVPIRDEHGEPMPGVRLQDCGPKAGLNGVDNGRIWFDHVRVPRENLLDRYGEVDPDGTYRTPIASASRRFFTMLGTLVQGRISVGGAAGSATKLALTIAIRYGLVRRQFAPPGGAEIVVLDYLAHQRRLFPALARTYALHFAQAELVELLHETTPGPDARPDANGLPAEDPRRRQLEAHAAGLKAVGTWHATRTIQACREACGGAGYLSENRLPGLKADTDVFTTFEGDNTVLLQLLAKELLTGFAEHFGELDLLGTVRFVADQTVETVLERVGGRLLLQRLRDVGPSAGDEGSMLGHDWQLELFDWRARHLLETLARRLRAAAGGGDSTAAFAVFNAAQDHLLAAAQAHVDTLLLRAFLAGIEALPAGAERDLLDLLCDLFALSTIEADRGWVQEHGRLTAARSKAVVAAVNELCRRLRPHAATLVDAFGIPDQAIAAPIAQGAELARQQQLHDPGG
jgi:acyl-CoA oxidase